LMVKDRVNMGVGKNCHIEHAILDKNCKIGDNVSIRGGEGLADVETDSYCIVDGIVVVKKGATIAHGSKIGL
jgi:glucose-1-phosphate adenylyltransferase